MKTSTSAPFPFYIQKSVYAIFAKIKFIHLDTQKKFISNYNFLFVLTSEQLTSPAMLPPPAQIDSTTPSTLLFTRHLVFPRISKACTKQLCLFISKTLHP